MSGAHIPTELWLYSRLLGPASPCTTALVAKQRIQPEKHKLKNVRYERKEEEHKQQKERQLDGVKERTENVHKDKKKDKKL